MESVIQVTYIMRLLEVKGNDGSGRTLSRAVVAWANASKIWYGTEDALKAREHAEPNTSSDAEQRGLAQWS